MKGGNSAQLSTRQHPSRTTALPQGAPTATCEDLALILSASQANRCLAVRLPSRLTRESPISCTRRRKASWLTALCCLLASTLGEGATYDKTDAMATTFVEAGGRCSRKGGGRGGFA